MAQSILIFDFGTNEEAAQQARHKIDGWKQVFRLGDKIAWKFERVAKESESEPAQSDEKAGAAKKGSKKKPAAKKEEPEEPQQIRILVRLNFSDHEKLSHQRWLDRIPTEEPFKAAQGETIRHSDPGFADTAARFDALA